jgi:hypothetical protein
MNSPPIVTIDTNCINSLEQNEAMNTLERWHREGKIEIRRTSVMDHELASDAGGRGEKRRRKAGSYGHNAAGFQIGHSRVGGYDAVGGAPAASQQRVLADLLHPGVEWNALSINTRRDIWHLAIHLAYHCDFFVTLDGEILDAAPQLADLGLAVLSPSELVEKLAI